MNTNESRHLRDRLVDAMRGHQAHLDFDSALEHFPVDRCGEKPPGAPHSAWQLLEHMRLTQWDLLEFSRNPEHESPEWPEGYWPKSEEPPSPKAWSESVAQLRRDATDMSKLVLDLQNGLFEPFEHGEGQDLLREALLAANHNSYHLGQLVFLGKMLEHEARQHKDDPQESGLLDRLKRQSLLDIITDTGPRR